MGPLRAAVAVVSRVGWVVVAAVGDPLVRLWGCLTGRPAAWFGRVLVGLSALFLSVSAALSDSESTGAAVFLWFGVAIRVLLAVMVTLIAWAVDRFESKVTDTALLSPLRDLLAYFCGLHLVFAVWNVGVYLGDRTVDGWARLASELLIVAGCAVLASKQPPGKTVWARLRERRAAKAPRLAFGDYSHG